MTLLTGCTSIPIAHTLAHHDRPFRVWGPLQGLRPQKNEARGQQDRHHPRPWRHTITAAQLATPNTTASKTTSNNKPMGNGSSWVEAAGRATPSVTSGDDADVVV